MKSILSWSLWLSLIHWLPREVGGVSSLGDTQKLCGCGLGQLALGGRRLDKMTSRGPFQPQLFLLSVIRRLQPVAQDKVSAIAVHARLPCSSANTLLGSIGSR